MLQQNSFGGLMFNQNQFGKFNFIITVTDFVGVFRIITERDLNGFILRLELYRFLKSNQYVIDNIIDQNRVNPTDSKLLDRVSSELIHKTKVNYAESLELSSYLNKMGKWCVNEGYKGLKLDILGKISVPLTLDQIRQFYQLVESFSKNYFMLESVYSMIITLSDGKVIRDSDNVQNLKNHKVTDSIPKNSIHQQPPDKSIQEEIEKQEQCKPKDEFEELIQYCYHSNLKSLIIHYVLNYYQFIQQNDVKIEKDENKYTFVTPNILPYALSMDSQFFYTYILSDKNIPMNNIQTYANKLIKRILFDKLEEYNKNPMYLMISNFMLLVYSIRYLVELYPQIFDQQYEELISNTDNLQQRVIQHYTNSFLNDKQFQIEFKINSLNLNLEKTNEDCLIDKISEEESHIIPVSQELFVETVLGKLRSEGNLGKDGNLGNHPDFKLSNKKVIDIQSLIASQAKKPPVDTSKLINSEDVVDPLQSDVIDITDYLNYKQISGTIITKSFQYITQYSSQENFVPSLIKDLPKDIINLFPVIVKDILTNEKLDPNLDNTYDYYRVVVENLPRPELLNYTVILFIVFQIVIPYYYSFHKKTVFKDCLL
jgi:hypothetical protein